MTGGSTLGRLIDGPLTKVKCAVRRHANLFACVDVINWRAERHYYGTFSTGLEIATVGSGTRNDKSAVGV